MNKTRAFFIKKICFFTNILTFVMLTFSVALNISLKEQNDEYQDTLIMVYNEALLQNKNCEYLFDNELSKKNKQKIDELEKYLNYLKDKIIVE